MSMKISQKVCPIMTENIVSVQCTFSIQKHICSFRVRPSIRKKKINYSIYHSDITCSTLNLLISNEEQCSRQKNDERFQTCA